MIDIFLDGADLNAMREGRKNKLVKGFTTNPTLCRSSGITDYEAFCKEALEIADGLPISFEVFSDEPAEILQQAKKIASWGGNVNVKIPVTNTQGVRLSGIVRKLSDEGIICNVTAVFTTVQILDILYSTLPDSEMILSIFAGRIADTGVDPMRIIHAAVEFAHPKVKILWASPREVLNIYQAKQCGCHIITVTPDLLAKYEKFKGKDLTEFSLSTVKMFYDDAKKSNYQL